MSTATKTDASFAGTRNIHEQGAMDVLISDQAKAEISKKVKDILCMLCIDDWQSKTYYQHMNFAEREYWDIKANTNKLMTCLDFLESCGIWLCTMSSMS